MIITGMIVRNTEDCLYGEGVASLVDRVND